LSAAATRGGRERLFSRSSGGAIRSDGHVRDAQAANIGVELDFDHPILAAPEIVVPEMLYSPPCPI
jgi:hypothetical protein